MYYRNCPKCGEKIFYSTKYNKIRAEKRNTNCKSCSATGRPLTKETRRKIGKNNVRYWLGKKLTNEHKENIGKSNKGKKRSEEEKKKMGGENHPMFRKKQTEESKRKMSEFREGKTYEEIYGKEKAKEIKQKKSELLKSKKREPFTEETRKRMRLSAKKRIERDKFNGNQMMPGHNPEGCKIIDEYNKKYGFNFQHAENGGEVCIDGFWPDGIDQEKMTIIEIDERHHFNSDGKLKQKDIKRQDYLEGLGYKFIRVRI
jgi:hypothetical protein